MVVRLSSIRSYGIAALTLAIATGVKLALGDALGADAPFALFGLAIIASGALGGPRSAFFASVLGALVDWYYFMSPYESFAVTESGTLVRVFALLGEGIAISAIVTRVDSARRAAEQTASRLSRLQSLTSALASAVTPFDVAERTVRSAVDALGAAAGIFIQPAADGALEVLAHCGIDAGLISAFKPDADYPVVLAFRQGRPQWVESAAEFARSYAGLDPRLVTEGAAAAALPLIIGDRRLGAIAFRFGEARSFSGPERELMQTLANQSAQAFERAQMFAEEVRSRARLETLNGLMQGLSNALTRAEVAEIVVERAMKIAQADTCTLYATEQDGSLRLIGDRGVDPTILERVRRISSESGNPSFESIRTGETLWAETEQDYLAIYPALASLKTDGPRAHAFWSVPLVAEGAPIGLLGMGFYAPRRFPPEERAFVLMLARHCAQAVRRAERLEAERAARSSAERLRSSFETTLRSIGDAVIATDTQKRVTLMNPVAEQLTGWPESEAVGQPLSRVFQILNEATRAEAQDPVDRVLREGVIVGLANHTMLIHRDAHETPIDDSAAPIRGASGHLDGVVLVFRDVSAKKREETVANFLAQASAVLAESLDYRATLASVSRLAVPHLADWCAVDVVSESDGKLERVAVNHVDPSKIALAHALERKYPPDPDAKSGRPNVLRTGRSELIEVISDEMLQRAAVDAEHLRLARELRLRSAMVVPLLARGRVLGAMTFVWAESGRVYTREDLGFVESLAQRCAIAIDNAQLYAGEQSARQAADIANRSKDEFLAIMGHELRNPLAPMASAVHLMKLREGSGQDRELAILERQLRHMLRLIEDLLDVSRVLRDKVELTREVLEIGEVVANAVEMAAPLIDAKQQHLQLEAKAQGLAVDVDPVRMAQVLANLLTNAAKYTDRGGEIRVTAFATEGRVAVSIEDSGVGIEPDLMPRLFELFSQGEQGIERRLGGLGIGLAIASRLVKEHGGELTAHSEGRNRGSRFTVELPRAAAPISVEVVPAALPSVVRSTKRVLIVDDNEDSGELLAMLVQRLGHEAQVAFDGANALERAQAFEPDIVLLDIGLPGMNGFEVVRRMRQLPACVSIPIIAVTGYTRESDRREALSAGFSEHFAKPIGLERLRDVLDLESSAYLRGSTDSAR